MCENVAIHAALISSTISTEAHKDTAGQDEVFWKFIIYWEEESLKMRSVLGRFMLEMELRAWEPKALKALNLIVRTGCRPLIMYTAC